MNTVDHELRGVLIAIGGGRLLLPNACVAEVISYAEPERIGDAPHWLLGQQRWRGWRLPVLSIPRLFGWPAEELRIGAKMAVLKALGGNPRMPYYAVVSLGFPRLVKVGLEQLQTVASDESLPLGAQARVQLGEELALVPDLAAIELLLEETMTGTA